jgi:hypothetical protein
MAAWNAAGACAKSRTRHELHVLLAPRRLGAFLDLEPDTRR